MKRIKGIVTESETRNHIDYLKIYGDDKKNHSAEAPNMKFGYGVGSKVNIDLEEGKVNLLSKQDGTCYTSQRKA